MTTDPLPIAIAAHESAKSAHHRLDRMNGSIDRLTTEVAKANAKSDEILIRLAKGDGEDSNKKTTSDTLRFVITAVLLFVTSSATVAFLTFVFHRH